MQALFAGIDAAACGSVLIFASPVLIIGSAIYFMRRSNSNKTPATAQATSPPVASEDKSLQDVGR